MVLLRCIIRTQATIKATGDPTHTGKPKSRTGCLITKDRRCCWRGKGGSWILTTVSSVQTHSTVSCTLVVSPHRTDAAQKKSTRLKSKKNQPFYGVVPLPYAGLLLANFLRKVAALCLGVLSLANATSQPSLAGGSIPKLLSGDLATIAVWPARLGALWHCSSAMVHGTELRRAGAPPPV